MSYINPTGTGIVNLKDARDKALAVQMEVVHARPPLTHEQLTAKVSELARVVVALADEIGKTRDP